jgi:hypothetical protein
MNTKNKRTPLGRGLDTLMRTSAVTQLDRRSITIRRLQERVSELELLLATVHEPERRAAEARRDYVLGRISYRELLAGLGGER